MIAYKGIELDCTQTELDNYISSINVTKELRTFDQKYNNVNIKNPTGEDGAKYYVLSVGGSEILQTHVPFTQGFVPITDVNAQSVIDEHVDNIIDNMVLEKFKTKEVDEITSLKQQIEQQNKAIADLTMAIAMSQTPIA